MELLTNVYIGRNVVPQHLEELNQLIEGRSLRLDQEQILAVFDCIIVEEDGTRVGGLTLHDYAILTTQNLVTWGRGRSKNTIDKFPWPYLTINRYGRRNAIEGAIKFTYRAQAATGKRKISLRPKDEDNIKLTSDKQTESDSEKGIVLYLDLMPLEEVPVCHKMMKFLIANYFKELDIAEFRQNFQKEIEAAAVRFVALPATSRAPEEGDEEERILRLLEKPRHPVPPANPYRGVSSPYQLGNSRPAPTSQKPAEARPVRPAEYRPSETNRVSNTSSSLSGSKLSKLDAFESGDSSRYSSWKAQPAPEPLSQKPRPIDKAPAELPVDKPTLIPTPITPPLRDARSAGEVLSEGPGIERKYPATSSTTLADAPNIYTLSRIAHGLLEGPQNLGRNLSDVSQTTAILASLPGLLSNNTSARQASIFKLREIFEGGYLENNSLLSFAVTPLLKSLMGGFGPPELQPVPRRERTNIQVAGKKKDASSQESIPSYKHQTETRLHNQSDIPTSEDENLELPMLGEEIATDNLETKAAPISEDQSLTSESSGAELKRIKFEKR